MSKKVQVREPWRRAVEKELSRDLDAHLLEAGHSSSNEIAIQNDFFASLNLSRFRISAIGGESVIRKD